MNFAACLIRAEILNGKRVCRVEREQSGKNLFATYI